jgi:hypothetical protein
MPRDEAIGEEFLSAYAGNVIEAVERIAAWIGGGSAEWAR